MAFIEYPAIAKYAYIKRVSSVTSRESQQPCGNPEIRNFTQESAPLRSSAARLVLPTWSLVSFQAAQNGLWLNTTELSIYPRHSQESNHER